MTGELTPGVYYHPAQDMDGMAVFVKVKGEGSTIEG